MASDFRSMRVTGRRSNVGHLIKTKAGKIFIQQSSKEKKNVHQNDYQTSYVKGHGLDEAYQVKFIGMGQIKRGGRPPSLVKFAPILFL